MFLCKARKIERDSVKKMVYFRLLNAYSHTQKTQFLDTLFIIRKVPSGWKVFIMLDISEGFFHIPICDVFLGWFCFKSEGRGFVTDNCPKDGH